MKLKIAIGWTMLGNITAAGCQWGYILVLAKFSTAENVGYYAFAQSIVYPVFSFMNLQLRRLQVTDQNQQVSFNSYRYFAAYSGFFSLLISMLIGLEAEKNITKFLPILASFGLSKYFELLSDTCYGKLQQQMDMKTVSTSLILRSITGFVSFSILIILDYSLWQACLITAGFWLAIYLTYDVSAVKKYQVGNEKIVSNEQIKSIIKLGLPLGILILLNQIHLNVPRYFLKSEFGMEELGFYSAIASLITIGNIIISSIGQTLLPEMAKSYAIGNKKRYGNLLILLIGISFLVGGLALSVSYWFGQEVLLLLYSPEFSDKKLLFIWVMLAGAMWYLSSATGTAITSARQFSSQAWLAMLVVLTTIISCYYLIPINGAVGAAKGLFYGSLMKFIVQFTQLIYIFIQKR